MISFKFHLCNRLLAKRLLKSHVLLSFHINNFQEKKIIIIIISLILLNENDKIKFLKIINYINILLK